MGERIEEPRARSAGAGDGSDRPLPEEPAMIRAEIEGARARMSDTLDELGERLNPTVVKERIKDGIREATIGRVEHMARKTADRLNDSRHSVLETVRENPLPAAMVGIGLAWLYFGGDRARDSHHVAARGYRGNVHDPAWNRSETSRPPFGEYEAEFDEHGSIDRTRDRVAAVADTVREGAGDLADSVRTKASHLAHQAQEKAGRARDKVEETAERVVDEVGERARETAERVREQAVHGAEVVRERTRALADNVSNVSRRQARRVEEAYFENPFALGAMTLAAGVAVGLSIPRSDLEVDLIGERRDQLVDSAKDAARETTEKVQHVAERVIDEGKRTVAEAARDEGLVPPSPTA